MDKILNQLPKLNVEFQQVFAGVVLSCSIAIIAYVIEIVETKVFHHAWLESIVIAILLGTLIRSFLPLAPKFLPGITFSSKTLLEIAIVLLGAGISVKAVIAAGYGLLIGIAVIVFLSIAITFGIGKILRLPAKLALLIACGNSICGNSAIAATAPVIKASSDDVASSIAFTAVLGIVVILVLPVFVPLLGLTFTQYGVLAGMTVYAVPQVLAATAPISLISVQTATLVKLVRVLMLGPVISILAIIYNSGDKKRLSISKLIPWFIIGFILMMFARFFLLIPDGALQPISKVSNILTVISMAALGLGVNVKSIAKSGGRVILTAILSLMALGFLALLMIYILQFQ